MADPIIHSEGLWHELEGAACAGAVKATCDSLERSQAARRKRMIRNISLYEGRPLKGLDPNSYFTNDELVSDDWDSLRVNLGRSLVHTAIAKIAGKQKPKTQFVVNDGDWSTKRKAKKLERFCEAHMLQRQGTNSDGWEQFQRAALHSCAADLGVIKFSPNYQEKKVDIRCVVPWRIMVDPLDAQEGQPLTLFDVYPVDKFKLAAQCPKFKREILGAGDISGEGMSGSMFGSRPSEVSRQVLVREAFRLQLGEDHPGRHAIIVGNADITGGEEWNRDTFPYEFLVWEQWFQGFYGTSIIDNVYQLCMELNAGIQRMSDAERVGSNQMVFVEEGTVKKEELESNIAKTIVAVQKGSMAPVVSTPNAISASTVQWWQLLRGTGHDMAGVSEMAATGEKQQGVDSGAAMRTLSEIGTERFSIQWQAYERRCAVGAPRQILSCARDIAKKEPDYAIKWPGGAFLKEFKLADVDLDEEMYVIQPYPVSGIINTPADRQSVGDELYSQQIIGPEARARIYLSKDPESEIAGTGTWSRLVERYIETWLDATKESEARGAEGDPNAFRYRPPVPFMPLADAIVQIGRAYAEAEMDGCPDYNLQFFLRFMKDCDRQIQKQAAQQAALQASAIGKGPAGPPMPPEPTLGPAMASGAQVPPEMLQ